eukprot:c20353_g1_i1 orf=1049-1723(+)
MSDQGGCRGGCPRVQLYQTIVFATPVLFASLLLLLFCLLYLKRRRGASIHSQMRGQFFAGGLLDTPSLEHGLSKSFRQRLPIVPFDEKFLSTCQDTQCTVCLGDYQVGEKIQQLPACNHSFHVQCIDEWLAKNVTCPICRTSVWEGGTGSVDGAQCQDGGNATEQPRGDEHGLWEERVVSVALDQSHFIRIDMLNGTSTGDLPASEFPAGFRPAREPAASMERS